MKTILGKIRAYCDNSASPVTIADAKDSDLKLVYANQAFLTLTGYDEGDIIGRNCRFLQGPDTDSESVDGLRTSLTNLRRSETVLLNYHKDGSTFLNFLITNPLFIGDEARLIVGCQYKISSRDYGNEYDVQSRRIGDLMHELTTTLDMTERVKKDSMRLRSETIFTIAAAAARRETD